MQWQEIRERYPHRWLVLEAVEAHSEGGRRFLDDLDVLAEHDDIAQATDTYRRLHRNWPHREFYVLHTNRETLDVRERFWAGIRASA